MSAMQAALGWAYGIAIAGYLAGVAVSGWRLWRFREPGSWTRESLALLSLVAGWPTGWRRQSQVRRGEVEVAGLVTARTLPLLRAFSAAVAVLLALVFLPLGDGKVWVGNGLTLATVLLACWIWRGDPGPEAQPRPA
jgi:glutathione S-transferase